MTGRPADGRRAPLDAGRAATALTVLLHHANRHDAPPYLRRLALSKVRELDDEAGGIWRPSGDDRPDDVPEWAHGPRQMAQEEGWL